jgi:hypothetical protein
MQINRRDLMKYLAGAAGIAQLSPMILGAQRALAGPAADPKLRFVMIRVDGAMDSTLGLHPVTTDVTGIHEKDLYLGYEPSSINPIRNTQITLGPSAENIAAFAESMAIVRGIHVGPNDLGHPFAVQHMLSGRAQESAPGWTSYIGNHYASPGTYVITNAALKRGTVQPFPTLLTSVLRSQLTGERDMRSSSLNLYKSKNLGLSRYLEFQSQTEKLKKFSEIIEESKKANTQSVPDEDMILASLYSGIGRVAQWDLDRDTGESLDTHTNHKQQHGPAQTRRWVRIAKFLQDLQKYDLYQDTLVAVITEFNRTPGLNDNGGKDHNYSDNAAAFFGRGVQGGKVIGNRQLFKRGDGFPYAYWAGSYLDFRSGESVKLTRGQTPANGLELIRPSDLWKSVATSLDEKLVHLAGEEALTIPGIFNKA